MKGQLDDFHDRWGDFEWRNDSMPTCPRSGDDTPLLGQDAGLRKVIRDFLDKYPGCAFQGVNGGGNEAGYDYARYASTISFSDGAVGILRNYYESLLLPPDKSSDIPDVWNPNDYNKATWRGLLCINFDMTGDTWDRAKLEGLRELIDIYHYLHREGVVGRWVRVYRPIIAGDDPTMYFQRLSGDRRRGIIIVKRPPPAPVTIRPKGLLPGETYTVTFHESDAMQRRSGADLMEHGIAFEKMTPGELIYLNLPLHPGSKLDKEPPTAPSDVKKQPAENMGYPGVELTWKPATDNNWISYYEVFRNGTAIDRVAKGLYYFDHSAGADLAAKYEIRAVDGAGNVSPTALADGPAAKRSRDRRRCAGRRRRLHRRMAIEKRFPARVSRNAHHLEATGSDRQPRFQRQARALVRQTRRRRRQGRRQRGRRPRGNRRYLFRRRHLGRLRVSQGIRNTGPAHASDYGARRARPASHGFHRGDRRFPRRTVSRQLVVDRWRSRPNLLAPPTTRRKSGQRGSGQISRALSHRFAYKSEADGTRTHDLRIKSPLLYRLSYSP